jgi:nucleoside-diphosphate-sugar epimerase
MERFLITGASGFVGCFLCPMLKASGFNVRAVTRNLASCIQAEEHVLIHDINASTNWSGTMVGVDVVIHLAARVHVMLDTTSDPLTEFRSVNAIGTENLARSAAASGVKRLIYVSSVKVNGEATSDGRSYSEQDIPAPQDPYGVSKLEAEQVLHRVAKETGLEVVIVRPPLVYGAGVKGNFAQMTAVLKRGVPLPFASVHNKRSLIYVGNLVDALLLCATHPAAAGQTYLVSDGDDLSTSELLRKLAVAMGNTPRLFACPTALLKLAGHLVGKSDQVARLLGSLQVDSSKIRRELGWVPPYSLQQGLDKTVGVVGDAESSL